MMNQSVMLWESTHVMDQSLIEFWNEIELGTLTHVYVFPYTSDGDVIDKIPLFRFWKHKNIDDYQKLEINHWMFELFMELTFDTLKLWCHTFESRYCSTLLSLLLSVKYKALRCTEWNMNSISGVELGFFESWRFNPRLPNREAPLVLVFVVFRGR